MIPHVFRIFKEHNLVCLLGISILIELVNSIFVTITMLLQDRTGGKPVVANRLSKEKSPYLLQHANNPVDWYPWSDEAFEEAKKRYSTCHWCHVT